jgi:hypothetical protein
MIVLLTRADRGASAEAREGAMIWPAVTSSDEVMRCSEGNAVWITRKEIEELSDSYVIPWFASRNDRPLFDRLRTFARLGSGLGWVRASADSSRWDFSRSGPHNRFASDEDSPGGWKVLMTRHVDAFRIDRNLAFQRFIPDPKALVPLRLGVESPRSGAVLTREHPSIVYRYPSRNDDTRTLIAALLPDRGFLYSKGYVHGLRMSGASAEQQLALLGYVNSFVADWWVRRFTDRHITQPVLMQLPLPDWDERDRALVAALTTSLVARSGVERLPGGVHLESPRDLDDLSELELQARIEARVASGFGLTMGLWRSALEDFSEDACPDEFVKELARVSPDREI